MEEQTTTEDFVEIPMTQPFIQPQGPPVNYQDHHHHHHGHNHNTYVPPPQHIAANEYEQQRYRQFNTQAPGIPPPSPVFHGGDSERFVAYNTGFNAGYVRGYYVAVDNMNNREGQRLHQRYVNRGGGAFGARGGGHPHGTDERPFVPRGRGRGGRGGGGRGTHNNSFVSPSGQHVQILRNVGPSGLSNVHFPPLQSTKPITTPVVIGDENV